MPTQVGISLSKPPNVVIKNKLEIALEHQKLWERRLDCKHKKPMLLGHNMNNEDFAQKETRRSAYGGGHHNRILQPQSSPEQDWGH